MNSIRPCGYHIYDTSSYMSVEKNFPFTNKHNGIPHWKCVLHCCDKCPSIFQPSQEANKNTTQAYSTIHFNVYRNVAHLIVHGIFPYNKRTTFLLCFTVRISDMTTKLYTQK